MPTHYFKVVLADAGDGTASLGAFVMPNAEIQPDTPLTAFVVPVDALERVSGTRFFPQYVDATRRAVLDGAALDWQVSALPLCCGVAPACWHVPLKTSKGAPRAYSLGTRALACCVPPGGGSCDAAGQGTPRGAAAAHCARRSWAGIAAAWRPSQARVQ